MWKNLEGDFLKINLFFLSILVNFLVILYYLYSFAEISLFHSKQGSKLKIASDLKRGDKIK